MLTPQEVSERAFPKVSFGGYGMAQVDEFLDVLTVDYGALYNENAVLKNKMKILVEKVEEYRATEEAMRKALLTAQRMADDLVREAEQTRNTILEEARQTAREESAALAREREAEEFRLAAAQKETAQFVERARALHARGLEYLDDLSRLCPPAGEREAEAATRETVAEIDENVQRLVAEALVGATAENLREQVADAPQDLSDTAEFSFPEGREHSDDPEEPGEPENTGDQEESAEAVVRRIDFTNLQFGREYEIK